MGNHPTVQPPIAQKVDFAAYDPEDGRTKKRYEDVRDQRAI
jgi:hypothetical protein